MLDHMLSALNKAWKKEQSQIVSASNQRGLIESGDKRCDSPGHNVKYLTHFFFCFFDQSLKKVITVSLVQITGVEGVSNRMEKQV